MKSGSSIIVHYDTHVRNKVHEMCIMEQIDNVFRTKKITPPCRVSGSQSGSQWIYRDDLGRRLRVNSWDETTGTNGKYSVGVNLRGTVVEKETDMVEDTDKTRPI